jgi:hypothetical protein
MRRIATLGLILLLAGCGTDFGHFINDTHTFQAGPNMPGGNSENLRRVMGQDATQTALTPEPGNIWPPPAGPMPTLMDLEKQSGSQQSVGSLTPAPTGSSTPPGFGGSLPTVPRGGLGAEAPAPMPRAAQMPSIGPGTPSAPKSYQTPAGTAVTTGSGPGYATTTNPGGGGQSIVVPNGNGTSTIIHADGTVETVPTPK